MAEISEPKKRKIEQIAERVLKEIRPSEDEIAVVNRVSNEIMGRLKKAVPKNVDIILAGSVARGTQIRGNSDIDIFLLFPKSQDERSMERKGLEIAKKIIDSKNGERFLIKYAEHPYLQIMLKDPPIKADIVPAFRISDSSEMGSAVDRTQLHNKFVMAHLNKTQKDNVRLLKAFMEYHNVYGAEAEVEGFSGYLCELLIHVYGSFASILHDFSTLRLPIWIDAKTKERGNDGDAFKRFNSNFIVIDPTDPDRNVAAGVSEESLARFVLAARRFIQAPSLKLFYSVEYSDANSSGKISKIAKGLGADIFLICFKIPEISEDIIWQQLKKLNKKVSETLEKNSFKPIIAAMSVEKDEALLAFFVNKCKLHSTTREGPDAFIRDASEAFMKKHKTVYVKGRRLVSIERPKYADAEQLIRSEMRDTASKFPSYLKKGSAKLIINSIPEEYAKLLYRSYMEQTNL